MGMHGRGIFSTADPKAKESRPLELEWILGEGGGETNEKVDVVGGWALWVGPFAIQCTLTLQHLPSQTPRRYIILSISNQ